MILENQVEKNNFGFIGKIFISTMDNLATWKNSKYIFWKLQIEEINANVVVKPCQYGNNEFQSYHTF